MFQALSGTEVAILHEITQFIERTGPRLGEFDVLNYSPRLWPHLYLLEVAED